MDEKSFEHRCSKCNKLLYKGTFENGMIETKCSRCGQIDHLVKIAALGDDEFVTANDPWEKLLIKNKLGALKLAFDNASDHIIVTDPQGKILYANRAASKITGFDLNEMIGKKAGSKDLWGGRMNKPYYEKLWDTISIKKIPFVSEVINKRKNGQLYTAAVSIAPILNTEGNIQFYVGIERDITNQRNEENKKNEFRDLSFKTIQSSLNHIDKIVDEMIKSKVSTKDREKFFNEILRSTRVLSSMINNILTINKIDSLNVDENNNKIRIVKYIKELVSKGELANKFKIKFSSNIDEDIIICGTNDLIYYALMPIISNAAEYSNNGNINIDLKKDDSNIIIIVSDAGIGIPENEQPHIFQKFYRGQNAQKVNPFGSGLGLSIAEKAVKSLNGEILLDNSKKGSNFKLSFPIRKDC